MKNIKIGLIAGIIYGALVSLMMLPMDFSDKPAAIIGAFINRFAIGLLIPTVNLKLPYWLQGLLLGILLSLPDAIITKSYEPILGLGIIGGLVIGLITQKLVGKK